MNILELTGMKSTKYGGVESYFAELVKICRVDKFIFVYESMPISENYVNDINKWGGVILCKQSISTFQYFKFVIGVIKREKIDIVHYSFWKLSYCTILANSVSPDSDYFNPS